MLHSYLVGLVRCIMIECCTKKRMLLAIAALIVVSIVVLIIESKFSLHHALKDVSVNESVDCWDEASYEVIGPCALCSDFDMKAQKFCSSTGFSELLRCTYKNGTTVDASRSCPKMSWLEERNFWLFEGVSLVVGLLSYGVVCARQKRLDRLLLEKVNKQIAAGV